MTFWVRFEKISRSAQDVPQLFYNTCRSYQGLDVILGDSARSAKCLAIFAQQTHGFENFCRIQVTFWLKFMSFSHFISSNFLLEIQSSISSKKR